MENYIPYIYATFVTNNSSERNALFTSKGTESKLMKDFKKDLRMNFYSDLINQMK